MKLITLSIILLLFCCLFLLFGCVTVKRARQMCEQERRAVLRECNRHQELMVMDRDKNYRRLTDEEIKKKNFPDK